MYHSFCDQTLRSLIPFLRLSTIFGGNSLVKIILIISLIIEKRFKTNPNKKTHSQHLASTNVSIKYLFKKQIRQIPLFIKILLITIIVLKIHLNHNWPILEQLN